jgi:hypothetical protein
MGIANVNVDGNQFPVDLYAPTTHWKVVKPFQLVGGEGVHFIQIQVSPNKNPLSKGNLIVVDGFQGANIHGWYGPTPQR